MAVNGCRIGKITVKGGAELRVLESRHAGNPEIIGMLIGLLDRARRGKLVAFGMVAVNHNGVVGTAWSNGDGGHHHELASGALSLTNRLGGSE